MGSRRSWKKKKKIVREVIEKTVVKNKSGTRTYHLNNKEAYIVET